RQARLAHALRAFTYRNPRPGGTRMVDAVGSSPLVAGDPRLFRRLAAAPGLWRHVHIAALAIHDGEPRFQLEPLVPAADGGDPVDDPSAHHHRHGSAAALARNPGGVSA